MTVNNAEAGPKRPRLLIIGVGNEFRHDDMIGLIIVRSLAQQAPDFVDIRESSGEGASLINDWGGYNKVIIIDALQSGAAPGRIIRIDAGADKLTAAPVFHSSHALGVAEAVEMARAVGKLPEKIIIYGIEGRNFSAGEGTTPEVESAVPEIIELILNEAADLII
ncbi:Hydrogenase 2 maturation protease [Candidatus Zixiibacteriota bacterium]|nr:Hydrogenase 2 maturation protease [candidate division Zixibacteria bacterium]